MTEHEDLIVEARSLSEYVSEHIPGSRYKPVIDRLANALEKVTAERDEALELVDRMAGSQQFFSRLTEAEAERDARVSLEYHDSVVAGAQKQIHELEAERDAARRRNAELTRSSNEKNDTIDALAAVVEQVREHVEHAMHPEQTPDRCGLCRIERALNAAPSVALDRALADKEQGNGHHV
ncbi:hypothetical protein [Paramicrobacterium agarici]|uniref:hypothetical protein n=1 Tax=Paramicrobacterium agarici TaxID=630514 RepID=UPI00114FE9C9|nr:hypothetical protein [Microbacterium agarici]TQO23806.1 hypothetical protein FB385_2668 [Microbacterium agarici]